MAALPPAPSMQRSARAAARPGLKDTQRTSYFTQFHVIELEKFLDDQSTAAKATRDNISFFESMATRLQSLAAKPKITKGDVVGLIRTLRVKILATERDLVAASIEKSRAKAQISAHTTNNPNIHINISASAAFRSVVDDLDVIVHALKESIPPPTLHARDNVRLRAVLASKEAEIARLEKEIVELKGRKEETEGILINLLD